MLPCLGWERAATGGLQCWGPEDGVRLHPAPFAGGPDPPGGPEPLRWVPPASRVGDCKHGMMKFREERNLLGLGLSTGFHDRYFILNHSCLRLYKEVRVSPACPCLPFPCLHFSSQLSPVVTLCQESLRT